MVQTLAHGTHLVGSVPLASAEVVFRAVAAEIGDRLRRMPDGETGPRSDWIVWQLPVSASQPQLEVVPPGPNSWRPLPRVRLAEGARPESVIFEALGRASPWTPSASGTTRSKIMAGTGTSTRRTGILLDRLKLRIFVPLLLDLHQRRQAVSIDHEVKASH